MEAIIALMIPIFAVLGGIGIGLFSMYSKNKKMELLHQERKIAMEKGLPLPEESYERINPEIRHKQASLANRKAFIILFFIGLAFAWFFPDGDDPTGNFIGGVLILLSFAFLVISSFKYKMSDEEKELYSSKRDYGDPLPPADVDNDEPV